MLDIIGTLYGADGNAIAGWHANTPEPVPGWELFQVTPVTPHRVFAGHATHFYVFQSEGEGMAAAAASGLIRLN